MKSVLLCVTGLSPQIVTETVYALACGDTPWIPDEVHLVTTATGSREAILNLLATAPDGRPGWFHRLRADYALPAISFDESHIHVLVDDKNQPLDDIRTPAHNEVAADFITGIVRDLTCDADTILHVSIAGGRKTMGYYAGYALSLFGRAQDQLSHVLVSEPFESNRDFYYPTPYRRPIAVRRGDKSETHDAQSARVELARIPFVRLRDGLPDQLLAGRSRFSETVAEAQRAVDPPALVLIPPQRKIIADGQSLTFTPIHFAWYWLLAERRKNGLPGLHWSEQACVALLLEKYACLVGQHSADFERTEASYRCFDKSNAEPLKSHVNAALDRALGKRRAAPYRLALQETLPGSRYRRVGLELPASAIRIEEASA